MAHGMREWRHFRGFFGLRRSIVGLLSMVVLVGLGEGMAERFLPLYTVVTFCMEK